MSKLKDLVDERNLEYWRYRRSPRRYYAAYQEKVEDVLAYGRELRQRLATAGIPTSVAHAYAPRETGAYGGKDHLVVEADFKSGRLERSAGAPLCRKENTFSNLDSIDDGRGASCIMCLTRAEKIVERIKRDESKKR